jgi:uncharacterized membrane protein (UPF0127 family)
MGTVRITNLNSNLQPLQVQYCVSFVSRLMGLMFKKSLHVNEGVLLAEASDSRINAAIHMLFMNFDITVVWIDSKMRVVDKALAKKWKPYYAPREPAKYILETHPDQFTAYTIGDQVTFLHD